MSVPVFLPDPSETTPYIMGYCRISEKYSTTAMASEKMPSNSTPQYVSRAEPAFLAPSPHPLQLTMALG